jgi:heme exporter protein B
MIEAARTCGCLIYKDLLRELRAPRTWSAMLVLGVVLATVIALQLDVPLADRSSLVGGMFWLAAFFAGTMAMDRAIAAERECGCWQTLRLYPVAPATIFLAKAMGNFLALCCLDCVLVPAFVLFTDVSLRDHPWMFLATLVLANLGFSAVGTIVSALTGGLSSRSCVMALLLLPLISPVVLGAAQATRLLLAGDAGSACWRWLQLLAVFAGMFVALGALLFEFVMED